MISNYVGEMLKRNLMSGQPTRMKQSSNYAGLVIPPCGEFASTPSRNPSPPWIPQTSRIQAPPFSLHQEIEQFVAYMQPTDEEVLLRQDVMARLRKVVKRITPGATVNPVGSSVTMLCFPTSDIDMVVTFEGNNSYLWSLARLERHLRQSGFASRIDSVLHASVPLLRITDAVTGIQIDLTESDYHGERATVTVLKELKSDVGQVIKALVMVLKLFLSIRRLGTTYTGGINSYVLVWMVVAYVKLELLKTKESESIDHVVARMGSLSMSSNTTTMRRSTPHSTEVGPGTIDLGDALLGFLKFYGQDFDYIRHAIKYSSHRTPRITRKTSLSVQGYLLQIMDPADATIDMGCKAYAIKHIQATFKDTYSRLGEPGDQASPKMTAGGILVQFLGSSCDSIVEKRKAIIRRWKEGHS